MLFGVVSTFGIFLALLAGFYAFRVLSKLGWFFGWLRGMIGLLLIGLAVVLVLISLDLQSYKRMLDEKPILTMSFEKVEKQHYKVNVSYIDTNEEETYDLYGDQWQVDARIMQLRGIFEIFGAKPGYRLDRLSGRYYSLEDEHRKERALYKLRESQWGFDFWAWLRENGKYFPVIEAQYGSATFLPMEHGAIFQVSLSARGLVARPLNGIAEQAINRWQL